MSETTQQQGDVRQCKSCGANIYWAHVTKKDGTPGKMPFDVTPQDNGTHKLFKRSVNGKLEIHAEWVGARERKAHLSAGGLLRTSHFATCPQADQHRR